MYRANTPKPKRVNFNIGISSGGMGDAIASMPVIKYIEKNYTSNHTFHYWVPDYLKPLFRFTFPNIVVRGLSEQNKFNDWPTLHTRIEFPTFLRQHLTDFASIILSDIVLKDNEKDYIKPDLSEVDISKKFPEIVKNKGKLIVITSLFTSETRVFKGVEVNKLVDYIVSKGYIPVFVGKEDVTFFEKHKEHNIKGLHERIDFSKGINLLNKTNLIELLKVIDMSECTVGVDNGILHLACMTDTYVIGGYTTVIPEHRLPYRYGVKGWNYDTVAPDDSLECRFCQSNWAYDINQNFTKCYYVENGYDTSIKCSDQIKAEKFIKLLDEKVFK